MSYKWATEVSIGPIFMKFYGEKDGDTPQTPKFEFSRFMEGRKIFKFGGGPPPRRTRAYSSTVPAKENETATPEKIYPSSIHPPEKMINFEANTYFLINFKHFFYFLVNFQKTRGPQKK